MNGDNNITNNNSENDTNKTNITKKPWGREVLITVNEKYAFKEIIMNKGTRSSLQSHNYKLETIYVVSGKIKLETFSEDGMPTFKEYGPEESYTILPGKKHRVEVLEDSRLFEVSTPELDDVVRYDDDFGRTG